VGGATLITIPTMLLCGLPVQQAIGTNRFSALFSTLFSSINYFRNGKVNLRQTLPFASVMSTGAILGGLIVVTISPQIIKTIILVLMISSASVLLIKKEAGLKKKTIVFSKKRRGLIILAAFVLGVYGGVFGGTGPLVLMSFIYLMGSTFLQAKGNASTAGFIWSVAATAVFLKSNLVIFEVAVALSGARALGGWVGSSLALKIGNVWVRRFFIVLVVVLALKIAFFGK